MREIPVSTYIPTIPYTSKLFVFTFMRHQHQLVIPGSRPRSAAKPHDGSHRAKHRRVMTSFSLPKSNESNDQLAHHGPPSDSSTSCTGLDSNCDVWKSLSMKWSAGSIKRSAVVGFLIWLWLFLAMISRFVHWINWLPFQSVFPFQPQSSIKRSGARITGPALCQAPCCIFQYFSGI